MSEFAQKMNYQRAIQGELTRTICQLRPVMSARVHISIPQDSVFASEQESAKASVALKLRRGMPLSDEQVGGIVHLVSSAVESLKPECVDVIDQDGNVLSSGGAGPAGALSANQLKLKRQYENEIAANLQSMLTRIVGPDKAVVRVSADMDFDQKQTKAETYEPAPGGTAPPPGQTAPPGQAGVLTSQETSTETYSGTGAPSAIAGAGPRNASGGGDKYIRASATTQYQVSRKTEEIVTAPGQITRLSVAVLVDKSVPSSQVTSIREAVTAAAGVKQGRDQVTVQAVAFDKSTQKQVDKEMAAAAKNELIGTVAKNAGAVVLLLGFLVVLRSIVTGIKVQAPSAPMAVRVREPEPAMSAAQPAPTAAAQQAEQQIKQSGQQLSELPAEVTQSNPEELARLVRSWMSEQ
jgi:flagellar M-ring protein FliF